MPPIASLHTSTCYAQPHMLGPSLMPSSKKLSTWFMRNPHAGPVVLGRLTSCYARAARD